METSTRVEKVIPNNFSDNNNTNKVQDALFFPEDTTHQKPPCKDYLIRNSCIKRDCTDSHIDNSSIGRLVNYICCS